MLESLPARGVENDINVHGNTLNTIECMVGAKYTSFCMLYINFQFSKNQKHECCSIYSNISVQHNMYAVFPFLFSGLISSVLIHQKRNQ